MENVVAMLYYKNVLVYLGFASILQRMSSYIKYNIMTCCGAKCWNYKSGRFVHKTVDWGH